ncbi:diadenosine tetraphosphate hydrolase [Cenarchaeum symbiosum A]|uniref:Diadenosine tetraphosphate hydrolase n=1 Tax=Cenarchaeum symbiosum (strain A) TaxID=414004 RepID=A0RUN5_CENSY|nr:diadenosine tetraphosphate hydrolase [Cenarchaeum symbiosum A]
MRDADCVFCKIASGELPARIISETGNTIAFMDAFPVARGHSLVIPKGHYERMQEIPESENADLFEVVRRVVARVDEMGGSTLVALHNGRGSGQEVPHAHVHLIPRSEGDGAGPVHSMFGGAIQLGTDETFEIYDRLKG